MTKKYAILEKTDEYTEEGEKGFCRLAFERLISNLLSVKVWLFLIPTAVATLFLFWSANEIMTTTIELQRFTADGNVDQVITLTTQSFDALKSLFSSWLKAIGSLVVTIGGIREIWKVSSIKEETRRKKMDMDKE